jgi:predicted RNA-binding protein with PIN domain
MSIIIDGYNYIGRSREFKLSDPEVQDKLIYLMGQYCNKVHKSLTLVFDGNYFVDQANRKRRYGRVTVIYTSPIYTADEMIKKTLREQEPKHRKAILVVSSDEEILDYAKSHGASAMRSEEFERTINQALVVTPDVARANIRISSEEVQEWLKVFEEKHPEHEEHKAPEKRRKVVLQPRTDALKTAQVPTVLEKPKHDTHSSRNRLRPTRKQQKHDQFVMSETEEELDRTDIHLSSEEVQEWLKIFGAKTKNNKH